MHETSHPSNAPYDGSALIADPIHQYVSFTVPYAHPDPHERTEKDLIDSPWVQRLRYIYQLQSARWVYPSAEHTRFVHSLGTMHVAGRFARHLYPFLRKAAHDVPSANFVEELLRITALVHDIGHGPFCHFFDDNFLHAFHASHEKLGQIIIREYLGPLIRKIRRSPSGSFAKGEELNPDQIAHVILKEKQRITPACRAGSTCSSRLFPVAIPPITWTMSCGIPTCAAWPSAQSISTRLIHYTIITGKGFTIHKTGLPALQMFLNTRMYLYSNVYFHRTTRAIDIHLRDIFGETMKLIFPHDPRKKMDDYLTLTDWSLLEQVRQWKASRHATNDVWGKNGRRILSRDVKWKMAYSTVLKEKGQERGMDFPSHAHFEQQIKKELPTKLQKIEFRVDMAPLDPRPDPKDRRGNPLYVYDPGTKGISTEPLEEFLDLLPTRLIQFRIYALDHQHDEALSRATATVLNKTPASFETNF